jgi:hypothetical protein
MKDVRQYHNDHMPHALHPNRSGQLTNWINTLPSTHYLRLIHTPHIHTPHFHTLRLFHALHLRSTVAPRHQEQHQQPHQSSDARGLLYGGMGAQLAEAGSDAWMKGLRPIKAMNPRPMGSTSGRKLPMGMGTMG